MWINKNEYENMKADVAALENRIDNLVKIISKQEKCIKQLMRMHDLIASELYSSSTGEYVAFNYFYHQEPTTNIKDIDNLTFTELAEYVINKKPITRIREHEVVVCPKEDKDEQD